MEMKSLQIVKLSMIEQYAVINIIFYRNIRINKDGIIEIIKIYDIYKN